nr:unnamed protein product [Callosobruchus chinensis]
MPSIIVNQRLHNRLTRFSPPDGHVTIKHVNVYPPLFLSKQMPSFPASYPGKARYKGQLAAPHDFIASTRQSTMLGVARLEALLHTLVENKVEALKNESARSSPRRLLNRLRVRSKACNPPIKKNEVKETDVKRKEHHVVDIQRINRPVLKHEMSLSSPELRYQCSRGPSFEGSSISEDDRRHPENLDHIYIDNSCPSLAEEPHSCCCNRDLSGQIRVR